MKITQPLTMIYEFLSDVLCDTYQVEGGYFILSDFNDKITLQACCAADADFANDARLESFCKALSTVSTDLNANNDEPDLIFDADSQTILATGPEVLIDFLDRFSKIYNYGWENSVSDMVTIPADFKLTDEFRAQAEEGLNDPAMLRALDQSAGYADRDALYIAILKIQHYQSQHAVRPLYTLGDIRGALQADRLCEMMAENRTKKTPQSLTPRFWVN